MWALYVFQTGLLGVTEAVPKNLALVAAVPLAVALRYAVRGDWPGVVICFFVGTLAGLLYWQAAPIVAGLDAALQRESELKVRLVETRVSQERARIAEELHDGVGADLAALVWRARALTSFESGQAAGELGDIEQRALAATEQLRDAVLGLRARVLGWDETIALLRRRCAELCGGLTLDFDVRSDWAGVPGTTT